MFSPPSWGPINVNEVKEARFDVGKTVLKNRRVLCVMVPCKLRDGRKFSGFCCLYLQGSQGLT